jgi:hypothetical protein
MIKFQYFLTPLYLVLGTVSAFADHGPGTSGGGVATQSAETLKPRQWSFNLQNDWTDFKNPSLEGKEEFDLIGSTSLTTLSISTGLTENFQAGLAYAYYAAEGAGEIEHDGERVTFDPDGFTDLWLNAKYRLYRGPAGQFAFYGGIKAPIGETDIVTSEGDRAEPPSMPGSGAWDGMFGAAYTYALNARLTLDASVQYIVRGEHFDYQIGNRLDAGVALGWRICGDAESFPQVSLMGEALVRSMEKSESEGETLGNTGGTVLLLAPGFRIGFSKNAALSVSAQLPVMQDLNGEQVESRFRISSALTFTF